MSTSYPQKSGVRFGEFELDHSGERRSGDRKIKLQDQPFADFTHFAVPTTRDRDSRRTAEADLAFYMELRWRSKRECVSPAALSWAACAAGERDEAIRLLREAQQIGDPGLVAAKYWADFAELREDRFVTPV